LASLPFLHSPIDGCKLNSAGSFSFFQWMNGGEPASDSNLQPSLRAETAAKPAQISEHSQSAADSQTFIQNSMAFSENGL